MANDLRFIETLDHSDFDKGIAESTASIKRLSEDANLASKGIKGMFDTPAMKEAAANFQGVEKAVQRFTSAMSRDLPMKQELRQTQQAATELEQIWRNLTQAEKQSAAGQELRQKIDMLIQRGGQLKDVMADVQRSMKFQASDTATLQATVQGIQALTAAAQVAAGAMNLLGMEQEDAMKVQKNLMAVLSVANGLQTIQNLLQKESALMMGLSAAKTAALTAAESLKAAVTKADTVATKAAAVAQWAWNAALTANPVGAVVVAVTALSAGLYLLASRTKEVTDAEKGEASALLQVRDAMSEAKTKTAEAQLELGYYVEKVKNFNGTAEQEKQLIDEINEKYGKHIGYLKDVADAKANLAQLSEYYIKLMEEEAKATALAAAYGDTYAKMIKGEIAFSEGKAQLERLKGAWMDAAEGAKFYAAQIRIANNLAGRSTSAPRTTTSRSTGRTTTSTTKTDKPLTEGTSAWYDEQIKKLQDLQSQTATTTTEFKKFQEQIDELTRQRDFKFGDWRVGLTFDKQSLVQQVNESIGKLSEKIKPMVIPVTYDDGITAAKYKSEALLKQTEGLRLAANAAAGAFRNVGNAIGGMAGQAINVAGLVAQAIATIITGYATATAQAASMGPWAWVAFALAGLAEVATIVSNVKGMAKFATGGIVGGNSYTGDRQLIRVNSGEMILNGAQQARLWSMITGGSNGGGEVTFRIQGQQLVGVLNNYNGKMGKVR